MTDTDHLVEKAVGMETFARLLDELESELIAPDAPIGELAYRFFQYSEALPEDQRMAYQVVAGWWIGQSLKRITVSGKGIRDMAENLVRRPGLV